MPLPAYLNNILPLVVAGANPTDAYAAVLPTAAGLSTAFGSAADTFITNYINNVINPLWTNTQVQPLVTKACRKASAVSGYTPLTTVPTMPATVTIGNKTIPLFPAPQNVEYKLYGNLGAAGNDIASGVTDMAIPVPTGISVADATVLLTQLRALEGLLIRLSAAQKVVTALSWESMASVLAFYRQEGDLVAPSSTDTLLDQIPPIENNFQPAWDPPFNLKYGVWLMDQTAFTSNYSSNIQTASIIALQEWFVAIAGFDVLNKTIGKNSPAGVTSATMPVLFGNYSAANWKKAGLDGDVGNAQQRYQALLANMTVATLTPPGGGNPILQVTPTDPVLLVSGVLTEALVYKKLLRDVTSPSYLHYHAGGDNFRDILVGAAYTAKDLDSGTYPQYKQLITDLDDLDFPDPAPSFDDLGMPAWLKSGTNGSDLGNFISSAGSDIWPDDVPKHYLQRTNLSRVLYLYNYYTALFK